MPDNLPTSQPIPSALPESWVDKLFARFAAMYGRHWFDQWADVPMPDVKAAWREDLARMSGDQIRKALEHCKAQCKFPPTCPEFVALCKAFAPAFDRSRALPERYSGEIAPEVRAAIAKLLDAQAKADPKDWARRILKGEAEGNYHNFYGIECAKRALGIAA